MVLAVHRCSCGPSVLKACETCGKEFWRTATQLKTGGRFCSFRCYRRGKGETSIERKVREAVESKGVNVISEFAAGKRLVFDLYVPSFNLLIECDGDYWHAKKGVKKRDAAKAATATRLGYRVERISESFINGPLLDRHLDSLLTQRSLL